MAILNLILFLGESVECELCGKKTNKLFHVIIEGVSLQVCENCAKFGKIKKEKIISNKAHLKNEDVELKEIREKEVIISPKAKDLLRKYREERGLTREELAKALNVKVNLIEKIERGITDLDLKDVEKIEKKLKLKLTEEVVIDYDPKQKQFDENETLTVGDVVKLIVK